MPIARHFAAPGIFESFDGQADLDVRVAGDEIGVVVIDELETRHGGVNSQSHHCQRDGNPKRGSPFWRGWCFACAHFDANKRKKLASTWDASFSKGSPRSSAANS